MPLLPHAGATRGTLARYAHGNKLLRRSAYADARSALSRYGFRVVLRTLIEKKGGIGSRLFRFFRLSRSPGFSASSASGSLALISSFAVLLCTFGFVWCRCGLHRLGRESGRLRSPCFSSCKDNLRKNNCATLTGRFS